MIGLWPVVNVVWERVWVVHQVENEMSVASDTKRDVEDSEIQEMDFHGHEVRNRTELREEV